MFSDQTDKIREFIDGHEELKELKSIKVKDILNGEIFARSFFSNHLRYILFVTFLAFCYIANHYKVEALLTELSIVNNELKELRSEDATTSTELMNISKQSEVVKKVRANGLDLEPLKEPPRLLEVD
jgi:hypothetical protein